MENSALINLTKPEYNFSKVIKNALDDLISGYKIDNNYLIEHPANSTFGDYSTNIALMAFPLVKNKLGIKSSHELALQFIEILKQNLDLAKIVDKIELAGPGFINFYLKKEVLLAEIDNILKQNKQYGCCQIKQSETWLIEHTSANPNKAMHLGHLRNNITGMAIAKIWQFLGVKVILDCVDNNRGIAIAKLMWGFLKFGRQDGQVNTDLNYWHTHQQEWHTPQTANLRPDRFMDEFYVKASEDFKNSEIEQQVRQIVIDWENEDQLTWALWQKVLDYVYQGQKLTLDRLGSHWDKVWHEHEHYKQGKALVEKGLQTGIFQKTADGAILTDLKEFRLSDTIVQKKDGTALYITQDLALTKLKKETFAPDKMFWIIGPEQTLAMKQVFAVCQQLGIGKVSDFVHLSFGYISIKGQGKMSSRAGNVVYIDELLDQAKKGIIEKIDQKKFTPPSRNFPDFIKNQEDVKENFASKDFSSDEELPKTKSQPVGYGSFNPVQIEEIGEKVGVGAVKYSLLKNGRTVDMAFDLASSISLEGNSGPYIQYTYARAKAVLKKAQNINFDVKIKPSELNTEELDILRLLYCFPEVVGQAGFNFSPHLICNYLYDLAQKFNTFYNKESILRASSEDLIVFRLSLTQATAILLKNGLELLGIAVLEEM